MLHQKINHILKTNNNSKQKSKNKKDKENKIPTKVLNAYAMENKAKCKIGNKHKQPLKLNEQSKSSRIQTSTYQFPEFYIKCQGQNSLCKDQITKKINENRQTAKFKECYQIKQETKKSNVSQNKNSRKLSNSSHKSQINQQFLQTSYRNALSKIFKSLDIFNRGKISQTNINRWVPQYALYFLGKIFQTIRKSRLTLSQPQFILMCLPLLQESNKQDISLFIKEANSKDNILKQSINISEKQNSINFSPIQKRISLEESGNHGVKASCHRDNLHLNEVIDLIKQKQRDAKDKWKNVKERQRNVPLNVLGQINYNDGLIKQIRQINQQIINRSSHKKTNNLGEEGREIQPIREFELAKSRQINPISQIKSDQKQKQKQTIQSTIIEKPAEVKFAPTLTFKMPKMKEQLTSKYQNHNNSLLTRLQQQSQRIQSISINNKQNNTKNLTISGIPKTTRHYHYNGPSSVRQSITSRQEESITNRSSLLQQNQRLDKLSSRLDKYLKQNVSLIEKSHIYTRKNSQPAK